MTPGVQRDDNWQEWWDARVDAMRPILGEPRGGCFHAPVPFYLGGGADVIAFEHHVAGIVLVTNDLIGDDQQIKNDDGWYELMLCLPSLDHWPGAPTLLSNLARYTRDARLNPFATMDIGPALPKGATISAFAFITYAKFTVKDCPASLLLCLGITQAELDAWRSKKVEDLVGLLKLEGVFPFTDLSRASVI
ncbi:MAG: suppressor of fused domain protein [Planctomycetaceae bacterium]